MGAWRAAKLALGMVSAGMAAGDGTMEMAGLERAPVVLDRDGVVVFARSGKLGDAEREELFRTLEDLLADVLLAR